MKTQKYRILLPVFSLLLVFLFVGGTLSPVKQTARIPLLTAAQLREQITQQLTEKAGITEITRTQSTDPSNYFIENKGQWAPEVKYLVRQGGMNAWITTTGVVYDFYKIERAEDESSMNTPAKQFAPVSQFNPEENNERIIGHVVNMKLQNARENAPYVAEDKSEAYYNYFIGNDESKWASYVGLYGEVTAANVYRNIDARYYFDEEGMRYDFVLNPGANVADINMNFEGAYGTEVNAAGELVIYTSLGEVTQRKLFAYQEINGSKQQVACAFTKTKTGAITFTADWKDKTKPLVIDPLVYSTFLGGGSGEQSKMFKASVETSDGSVILTGDTWSGDFPTSIGAYNTSFNGGDNFVTKINSTGTALVFSTFLGGSSQDFDNVGSGSIALDASGNVVLLGATVSGDFPVTSGAFDVTYNGGFDVFITKLNAAGSALIYSTFAGGGGDDHSKSLAFDATGNAYITGVTFSGDYPTTSGAYDVAHNGGRGDAFISKLNAAGSALIYSTYVGGDSYDEAQSISLDSDGNAYITGYTQEGTFCTTPGAFDESQNGRSDAFVTKLNPSGSALVYSTYIGGVTDDYGLSIATGSDGSIYLAGYAGSNFPTTPGAFDETTNGSWDGYSLKLNPSGNALVYSTWLGGSDVDFCYSLELGSDGNAYISGCTLSGDYPVTADAFDGTHNGSYDIIVTKLNANGSALLYSTFIGGGGEDTGNAILICKHGGGVALVGHTASSDFPTTSGAFDVTHNGSWDAYVLKLSDINLDDSRPAFVSSDTLYSLPGDTILVPINIQGFTNVGAISLRLNFDPTVTTFIEGVNWSPLIPGAVAGTANGVLAIGWEDAAGFSTDSTKLVDLKFVYHGDSTAFAFNQTICEITDIDEQPISITYTDGAVYPDLGTPLTGTLAYRNTAFTPLANAIVRILKNNTKIDSSSANTSGVFGWTNIVQGNYTLQTVAPSTWGGVNSTDALALRRFIAGLRSLDTLQILAGDVNNSGTVTSADALLIRRRFVELDTTFARGKWVFEAPSLRKLHQSQTQNILGICVGDVNASFIPGLAKQTPSIQYFPQGEIALQNGTAIKYPVYARSESNIGAVTLVFDFDPSAVSIAGIESKMDGLMYNVQNGQLIIAWDDLAGIEAGDQSPLLTILLTGKEGSEKGNVRFMLNEAASELADINANVLQGAVISSPSFSPVVPKEFALEQNFPNPFNPSTTIQYDIPTNAHVRVEIFNTLGEVVELLADAVQAPGRYSVEWNAKNFTTGVYFYRITAESGTKNFMQVKKLMLIK